MNMCIKQIKKLFCKEQRTPIANEQIGKAKELEIGQYNILKYLSMDNAKPKSWLELNGAPFSVTKQIINDINSTILTKEAISYIDNNDNAVSRAVQLIEQTQNECHITENGLLYLEYYEDNVLLYR